VGSALPLIVIYLYTKFHLKANSSFKVISRTRYSTDGQPDKHATLCPLWNIIKVIHGRDKQEVVFITRLMKPMFKLYCLMT